MKNKKLLKTILCVTSGIGFATSIPFTTTACGSSKPIPVDKKILPYEVYDIDQAGVLNGFKSGINLDEYNDGICNTMQIPASVTSIGDDAFANKIPSFIKNLTFADGSVCSSIGYNTFSLSTFITEVNLLRCTNLSAINSYCFENCVSLTSIIFPSSLEKIGNLAFGYCTSLTSVDLSRSTNLSYLGADAFKECSLLTLISFPSSLSYIDSVCFENCINLKNITWNSWQGENIRIAANSFINVCQTGGIVKVTNPTSGNDSQKLLDYLKANCNLPSVWTIAQ